MAGLDLDAEFHPLKIAVLTISDTRSAKDDGSGDLLEGRLKAAGHQLADRALVRDSIEDIRAVVTRWAASPQVEIIVTTGGTGFTDRDLTPEAVRPLFRREMDGFSVLFHQVSQKSVGVATLQSRALAGQIGETFIFCLPGSPGACKDGWDGVLAQEFDSRFKPCSLAGQIPRLRGICR
jgi:molybdenum cofactor biosynthesis protein B